MTSQCFVCFYITSFYIFQITCIHRNLFLKSGERKAHSKQIADRKLCLFPHCAGASRPRPRGRSASKVRLASDQMPVTSVPPAPPAGPPPATYQHQGDAVVGGGGRGAGHALAAVEAPLLALALLLRSHCAPHDPRAPRFHLRCSCPGTWRSAGALSPARDTQAR